VKLHVDSHRSIYLITLKLSIVVVAIVISESKWSLLAHRFHIWHGVWWSESRACINISFGWKYL